jgi:hypothetical protein
MDKALEQAKAQAKAQGGGGTVTLAEAEAMARAAVADYRKVQSFDPFAFGRMRPWPPCHAPRGQHSQG